MPSLGFSRQFQALVDNLARFANTTNKTISRQLAEWNAKGVRQAKSKEEQLDLLEGYLKQLGTMAFDPSNATGQAAMKAMKDLLVEINRELNNQQLAAALVEFENARTTPARKLAIVREWFKKEAIIKAVMEHLEAYIDAKYPEPEPRAADSHNKKAKQKWAHVAQQGAYDPITRAVMQGLEILFTLLDELLQNAGFPPAFSGNDGDDTTFFDPKTRMYRDKNGPKPFL